MFILKVSMWLRIKTETKNRKGQEMLSRLKHEVSRNSDSGSSLTEELFECQLSKQDSNCHKCLGNKGTSVFWF